MADASSGIAALAIAGLGVVISGAGLAFVAVQVRLAKKQLEHLLSTADFELRRGRQQTTVEFYMATVAHVNEWRAHLPDDWDKLAIDRYVRKAHGRSGRGALIRLVSYLGYFEALATAVHADVYDFHILNSIAGSRILNIATNYQDFFAHRRQDVDATTAYREITWLGCKIADARHKERPCQKLTLPSGACCAVYEATRERPTG
jgi:hypothetical protein